MRRVMKQRQQNISDEEMRCRMEGGGGGNISAERINTLNGMPMGKASGDIHNVICT